ncbi:MAG: hypothetical protein J6C46_08630 [Clostridia bacterium]|nr:hypothetical protein [Clostridia bacterium]
MNYEYDKVYINGVAFPYTPVHDASQNDLDLDAYTNTAGKTIRNRIRHDVKGLDFNIPTMTGLEMQKLMRMRDPVWFQCTFFDEAEWNIVTKKMYCSSPTYTKYYIDANDPSKNIYNDVSFSFVEE